MEHLTQGMERKWERHFRETRTTISIGLMLIGLTFMVTMVFLWPQKYSRQIFNERLKYRLMLDVDDFYQCDQMFRDFIINEPAPDVRLLSFYVFNVTNSLDVIRRGYKPAVSETGPYGYKKRTYKYDIYFEPEKSRTVTFKEYNILEAVDDPNVCETMFFKLDRNNLLDGDPCPGDKCKCKDPNSPIQSANPAFLNLIWKEGPHALLAQYSVIVYENIKYNLEVYFPEAVRAHLTAKALEEVYQFRFMMQTGKLLETVFTNLTASYTLDRLERMLYAADQVNSVPKECGLQKYFNARGCPWSGYSSFYAVRYAMDDGAIKYANITNADYPSLLPYLDMSNPNSFLNVSHGLPRWLGVSAMLGYAEFTFTKGFTMALRGNLMDTFREFTNELATKSFGPTPTGNQLIGSEIYARSIALFLQRNFLVGYDSTRRLMVYQEWATGVSPVICAPYGELCQWQFGAVGGKRNFDLKTTVITSIIDRSSKVNTNPNNLYFDGNGPYFHNSYRFCQEVRYPQKNDTTCDDIEYTRTSATFTLPAGLASIQDGISQINTTAVYTNYARKSEKDRQYYIDFACNISYTVHKMYREATDFHDKFVINYLNLYKDPNFLHNFTYGNWKELGHAQWGGGFVTYAMFGVRSIFNVKRDGMWHFGTVDYHRGYMEYSTWATRAGFPSSWIYSVTDAELLLNTLAERSNNAVEFRKNIVFGSTTLVGDGKRFVNNVGAIGEITFILENSEANFSCTGEKKSVCDLVQAPVVSSAAQCDYIEVLMYDACVQMVARRNAWLTECTLFQTSMTSPLQGIQCDRSFVYGKPHPFTKRRGNIISSMLYSLTTDIVLKVGLFCPGYDNCDYQWGGFFVTTTANRMLFEGYSDASVLKYLELKHSDIGLNFQCLDEPFDQCRNKNYHCTHGGPTGGGFTMEVRNTSFRMTYGVTPNEKYFAPFFQFTNDNGTMIWVHDMDPVLREESIALERAKDSTVVMNPIWAAYPAWNDPNSEAWQKYLQCSMRLYGGLPGFYNSCEDTHNTGREHFSELMNLEVYRGNRSVFFFDTGIAVEGAAYDQFQAFLWDGFKTYPYVWQQQNKGPAFLQMENPVIFDKQHGIGLTLSQSRLDSTEKPQIIAVPLRSSFTQVSNVGENFVNARRFSQDISTWLPLRDVGYPRDPFGMPYRIPIGMTSLERFSGFPLFLGTPHNYGNIEFGGEENQHITGTVPDERSQMTFIDYDPITGKTLRKAVRQQVNLRFFRDALFQSVFSSQDRCVAPTKTYTGSTGFGCFAYVPLLWYEDGLVTDGADFDFDFIHFYSRPDRAAMLERIGIAATAFFFIAGAVLYYQEHRKRIIFRKKIYVD